MTLKKKNTLLHQAFDKINKTIEALSKTEEAPTPSQAIDRIKTIIEAHTQGEATSAEEPPNPEESPIQDTQGLEATSAEESPTPEESPIGTQVLEATSAEGGAKISRQRSPSPQAIHDLSIFSKRPFPRSRDLGEDLEPKI